MRRKAEKENLGDFNKINKVIQVIYANDRRRQIYSTSWTRRRCGGVNIPPRYERRNRDPQSVT